MSQIVKHQRQSTSTHNVIVSTQIIRSTRAWLLALALHDALHPAPSVALNPTPDHDDLLLFFLRRGTAAAGPQTIRIRVSRCQLRGDRTVQEGVPARVLARLPRRIWNGPST